MALNTDRPINRAKVVGCAISATRNYLKSHGPTTLNPLFCINRAKTLKLCTHSRSPLFEFPKSNTSYKNTSYKEHLLQRTPLTKIPIAPAAPPVPNLPRLRALALFGRRPPQLVDSLVMPASENLHNDGSGGASTLLLLCPQQRTSAGF